MFATFLAVCMLYAETTPPSGGLSSLAWTLIVTLATALVTVTGALWKDRKQTYDDLKACNAKYAEQEEEILGLLKVLRVQMEKSKGGRPR